MATFQTYANNYERGIMGYSGLSILGLSCLGGTAAMLILMHGNSLFQMVQLFFVVVGCGLFNGAVLSLQNPKFIFKFLITAVVLCTAVIVANLFFIV